MRCSGFHVALLPKVSAASMVGDVPLENDAARSVLVEPDPPERHHEMRIDELVRHAFHAHYYAHAVAADHLVVVLGKRSYVRACCVLGRLIDHFMGMRIVLDLEGDRDRVTVRQDDASRAFATHLCDLHR